VGGEVANRVTINCCYQRQCSALELGVCTLAAYLPPLLPPFDSLPSFDRGCLRGFAGDARAVTSSVLRFCAALLKIRLSSMKMFGSSSSVSFSSSCGSPSGSQEQLSCRQACQPAQPAKSTL
jgi:hypothetical protein